jgi:putative ABC transport system substrate-binding protein
VSVGHRNATRRTVLAGLAAALAPGFLIRQAQARDLPRLGVLIGNFANDREGQARAAALVQGLNALDWKEGGTLRIDWRWAGGDPALTERYAAELVALKPAVILAASSPAVEAVRRLTSTIPIVFVQVIDPVAQGIVASLARPAGDVTGFMSYDPPMAGKWLAMLTQIAPPIARAGFLYNPATAPYAGPMLHAIEAAAPSLAIAVQAAPVSDDAAIEATMAALARDGGTGLLVLPSAFTVAHCDPIVALAARYRLPAVYALRVFTASGGLMSYGIDEDDLFRRSASYVDRILKGAKPGDLPVQAPAKFELVLNLKSAKALGVTIATSLLATADEVIE